MALRKKATKCQQTYANIVATSGPPSKYYPHTTQLNFADRTRANLFSVPGSLAEAARLKADFLVPKATQVSPIFEFAKHK